MFLKNEKVKAIRDIKLKVESQGKEPIYIDVKKDAIYTVNRSIVSTDNDPKEGQILVRLYELPDLAVPIEEFVSVSEMTEEEIINWTPKK